jgi:glycine/D-amino acid oxidase-like deaminating enzyme
MSTSTADVVICGAGIAGISAAYNLAVKGGVGDIVIVDERAPLSLTSDKSTECYRNWWPGPGDAMVNLMNHSIDILEKIAHETGNAIHLNRRGYLFATADPQRIHDFASHAEEAASLGAGPVRYHRGDHSDPPYDTAPPSGFTDQPTGADLITDTDLIRKHFPYLSEETVAIVHPRRCGWFSAQQLGMYLLEQARKQGVQLKRARVEEVEVGDGRIQAVKLGQGDAPQRIATRHFVNAAGPFLQPVGRMIGVELPVYSEFHAKIAFNDHLNVFPREAPLLIWTDPQYLPWTEEERQTLAEDEEGQFLLEKYPHGVHARPEGPADSSVVLILWTYDIEPVEPVFPPIFDAAYPEIVLRGLSTMIPGLKAYFGKLPKPILDGGYYTKTEENRPLVGPLPVDGAWVIGAVSGYGLMASPACGELLNAHITGAEMPTYAPWFLLERYQDPEYQELLQDWQDTGQL